MIIFYLLLDGDNLMGIPREAWGVGWGINNIDLMTSKELQDLIIDVGMCGVAMFNNGEQSFCKVLHIAIGVFFLNALWCGNLHAMYNNYWWHIR